MTRQTTWFRLADVVPLAIHALACTATRRHRTGGTPGGQLLWSTIGGVDQLTCPGHPDVDDRYQPPAANALMWRPEHRRSPHQDLPASRLLPLTDGPTPLITKLRNAAKAGQHWIVLTPEGPGHADAATSAHRSAIAPAAAVWSPAEVVAAQVGSGLYPRLPRAYPALAANGWRDHHGGLLTRFTRDTAAAIVADVRGHLSCLPPPDAARLRLMALAWDGDTIVITRLAGATIGEVDRCRPDADGWLALGAYLFEWEHLPDTAWPPIPTRALPGGRP